MAKSRLIGEYPVMGIRSTADAERSKFAKALKTKP